MVSGADHARRIRDGITMHALTSWIRTHRLVVFFVLAYALSWWPWPLYAAGLAPAPFLEVGPLLAALVVISLADGLVGLRELGSRMLRWRVRWYWYAVALGFPLAIRTVAAALNVGLGAPVPVLTNLAWSSILMVFAVRVMSPMESPLGEEPGWRGFALPALQADRSPLTASLILGVLVSGWHLPLVFVGLLGPVGLVGTVAVTFVYSWLFNRSGGSVLMTLLFHAMEGSISFGDLGFAGADATRMEYLYTFALVIAAVALVALDRTAWRRAPDGAVWEGLRPDRDAAEPDARVPSAPPTAQLRDRWRASVRSLLASLFLAALLMAPMSPLHAVDVSRVDDAGYEATIRRTAHGIPHVLGSDYGDLGFGSGYAQAEDNLCVIAEEFLTLSGERSRFLGSDDSYTVFGQPINNLDSDFFYRSLVQASVIENLLAKGPDDAPAGPSADARALVEGYAAGFNHRLRDVDDGGSAPSQCRDAPWVRPIAPIDVWRRMYRVATLLASNGQLQSIATAQPPTAAAAEHALPARAGERSPAVLPGAERMSPGSNAYALGEAVTANGRGLVLANPHFPWDGPERFYAAQLTIPGEFNVLGASLLGTPMISIGHNERVAWTHTVSTAQRYTPFELQLLDGDPTQYVVDGSSRSMEAQQVTVDVRTDDGRLDTVSRTLYRTPFGPLLVVPDLFDWSTEKAYAIRDANADNLRLVDTWLAMSKATSVDDLVKRIGHHQGLPFINTVAADAEGTALYADLSVVPHVDDQRAARCVTSPWAKTLFAETGLPVLDASTSECDWGRDPSAVVEGIFGPEHLPVLMRRDFVTNSNDSHWLSNPSEPLTGFARIIGDEGTARSLRTRLGVLMVQERLAGTDGMPGTTFDPALLEAIMFNNRSYGGELLRDDLVGLCEAHPDVVLGDGTTVALPPACHALRGWDLRADLGSTGPHLFREFMLRLPPDWFDVPFDPEDPVHTPRGLATDNPAVLEALGEAVRTLEDSDLQLDAPLGALQSEPRGTEHIPIHGGHELEGVFNMIIAPLQGPTGYAKVVHGSSFVQVTTFTSDGPQSRAILTYSQSADPESPYFADQTRMYSDKQWATMRFREDDILSDPDLRQYTVRGRSDAVESHLSKETVAPDDELQPSRS
jgi:acyl-homoserine-lactone acylase